MNKTHVRVLPFWEVLHLPVSEGEKEATEKPGPFDRLLLGQTRTEGMLLLTVDASVSKYKESVLTV